MTNLSFRVGDKAVYPAHGVAEITGIERREISGSEQTFYILRILENGMRIMVPMKNASAVGLRAVVGKAEIKEVYDILRSKEVSVDGQTWNRRYREYMEKIKTGSVYEIAEVLRDLFLLKVEKELSFGERKMLDTARSLLLKELSLATSREELSNQDEVRAIFGL